MTMAIPFGFARSQRVLAAGEDVGRLVLWVTEATPLAAIAEVRRSLQRPVLPVLVPGERFDEALQAAYREGQGEAAAIVGALEGDADLERLMQDIPEIQDILEARDDAPVIRMLNALFSQALRDGATDIHVEPYESSSVVRYRVDGILRDIVHPARGVHAALVSRIKIMAHLDIAEKRLPQDGRIMLKLGGRPVDVRVSTLPAGHGERVVLRLLDKEKGRLSPQALGMEPDTLGALESLVKQSHGIVLVTGPTGSGKTTTLYAMLSCLDAGAMNIMTVEDPIEYDLPGIGQTQVNARIGMTFARALRAILRQDPDVIMIGEIRDLETAQIAVQASLTGHLVLATLHTNDAASSVTRLTDMGIEPFLLSSSLLGILAQRLVRKLCPHCRTEHPAGHWTATGCPSCSGSGYAGRTGIHELLVIDDALREAIHDRRGEHELRTFANRGGFRSMTETGQRLASRGVTSAAELLRVTREA